MNPVKRILLPVTLAALFCVGCAHPTWMPYVGGQQSWPTSPGAFTDTNRAVLVYYGYPPVDYVVVGQINLWSQNEVKGLVGCAANEAKAKGADAVIVGPSVSFPVGGVLFEQSWHSPAMGFDNSYTASVMQHNLSAIAIKWKNPTGNPTLNPVKPTPAVAKKSKPAPEMGHKLVSR
jgi:hypothetical protein